MTPLPFHCSRMSADFLRAPCSLMRAIRGECEGCPDGKDAIKPTSAPRKWNIMPEQAPKREKAATVTPATPAAKPEPKPERKCQNCGFHVGANWSYCRPCTDANKKYGSGSLIWIKAMADIRRRRLAGEIRKGRKTNDGGVHRGGRKKNE